MPRKNPPNDFDILTLPREERDLFYRQLMKIARQAGLQGMSGECAEAAIAINQVVFNNQGLLIAGANTAFYEAGELIGHVAVCVDNDDYYLGTYYDTDGVPKSVEQILSWGILDADDEDWLLRAEDAWFELNEKTASEACLLPFASADQLVAQLPGSGLEMKIRTLRKAMNIAIRQHLAAEIGLEN